MFRRLEARNFTKLLPWRGHGRSKNLLSAAPGRPALRCEIRQFQLRFIETEGSGFHLAQNTSGGRGLRPLS